MSWFSSAWGLFTQFGPAVGTAVKHVVGFVPGGSVVGELVESAFKSVAEAGRDQQEAEAAMKNLATARELERLAGVFDACLGGLSKLIEVVQLHDGEPPEAIRKLIVTQLATDKEAREGFAQLSQEVKRFERIEKKLDEVLGRLGYDGDLFASLRVVVQQQEAMLSFIEELRAGGLGRDFFTRVGQMHSALEALAAGKAPEAGPALLLLEKACPNSGAVAEAEAVQAALSQEPTRAGEMLTRAARLRPGDRRLDELSRRVTVATSAPRIDTDRGGLGGGDWRRHFQPGQAIDGWTVKGLLGEGGMGAVFAVEQAGQARAMKVLPPALSEDPVFAAQFRKEILVLNGLQRLKHVVAFHDFGRHLASGCWYFFMERVPGESLQTKLDRDGPLPLVSAVALVRQLAGEEGLSKVHASGVTHRDIKPGNIIIRPDGVPVLVDFGVAGTASANATTQIKAYTARFASWEQLRQEAAGPSSDVYSLVGTLWYAITRTYPHTCDADELPHELGALREVLTRGLHDKPGKRPRDAGALAVMLAAVERGPLAPVKMPTHLAKKRENVKMPAAPPGRWPWSWGGSVNLLTLVGHEASVHCVAFSPDGSLVATASNDKTARVWEVANGKCLHTLSGHGEGIHGVAFSPDGRLIGTASWDDTAKLWDALRGECLQTLVLLRHASCS